MLRIGTASRDITPGRDLGLIGYEFRLQHWPDRNDGVLDPLALRVLLLLPDDAPPAAIVTLDLAILSTTRSRHLAKLQHNLVRVLRIEKVNPKQRLARVLEKVFYFPVGCRVLTRNSKTSPF